MEIVGLKQEVEDCWDVDKIQFASIGGSGTWSRRWPEDFRDCEVEVFKEGIETPFGRSTYFKVVVVGGKPVIRFAMHGFDYKGPSTRANSQQVFWILRELGVEQILIDASVGGVAEGAKPWDLVVADDYVSKDPLSDEAILAYARQVGERPFVRMWEPYCPRLRQVWIDAAKEMMPKEPFLAHSTLYERGVYYSTPRGRTETAAEIRNSQKEGGTVVGMTSALELGLARLNGQCVAALYPVVNYAEGLQDGAWVEDMGQIYRDCALPLGRITWRALELLVNKSDRNCRCARIGATTDLSEFPVKGA